MESKRLMAALASICISGCLYGNVDDAVTGNGLQGVTITVVKGGCNGTGCGHPVTQLTDGSGLYVFDGYGKINGDANVQIVVPAAGEETAQLAFSKPGYQTVTLYHRPNYQQVKDNDGNTFFVSPLPLVYLCPIGAVDSDGDGICDAAEARHGTNPFSADTDGDRLSDLAELYGAGGVDLHYFGASPTHKDVFIEADYYADRKPTATGIQRVVEAFAAAPVTNPDGTTGIALHVDLDDEIAAADAKPDLDPVWTDFDVIKSKYFPARRAPFFHYALFANTYNATPSSGISRGIPAHDFVVTLGAWPVPGGTELQQAGTLMHEFGHNLGLRHGGNEDLNYKANYLSLMSYNYQVFGLRVNGVGEVLDYSRLRIGPISESAISEVSAFSAIAPTTEAELAAYGVLINNAWRLGNASANLDVNGNGVINGGTIAFDLDRDGDATDLLAASQNDWLALLFDGGGQIGGASLLGPSAALNRPAPFLVPPDQAPPCMTPP